MDIRKEVIKELEKDFLPNDIKADIIISKVKIAVLKRDKDMAPKDNKVEGIQGLLEVNSTFCPSTKANVIYEDYIAPLEREIENKNIFLKGISRNIESNLKG